MKKKLTKSNYYPVKKEFGGGITSPDETKAVLEYLIFKGVFLKVQKSGEDAYMQNPQVSREEIANCLIEYELLS